MTVPSAIDQAIAGYDARKDLYGPASRCAAAAAESMRIAAEVLDVAIDARNSVLAVARRTNDEDIVAAVAADAAEASQAAVKALLYATQAGMAATSVAAAWDAASSAESEERYIADVDDACAKAGAAAAETRRRARAIAERYVAHDRNPDRNGHDLLRGLEG